MKCEKYKKINQLLSSCHRQDIATTTENGLMSAVDKSKLDNIEENLERYYAGTSVPTNTNLLWINTN
jgi:hypothetical protein